METITGLLDWLESREGLLSAITALAAMLGILYGVIAFIFPGVNRAVRRMFGHESQTPDADSPRDKEQLARDELASVRRASIAVLPLRTLSSAEDDRNMAAGIASEISADLAQLPDLRVASHLVTLQFQHDNVDLAEIASVLRVRYVLTGSFQRAGTRMRLMAELMDAVDGDQLWASTFDRDVSDLFEVQAEVSRSIVAAIGGELKLASTRIAYDAPTDNLDAWGLVQKAFNFWLTRFSPEDYDRSLTLLRRAVELDPEYAAAHASLAMIVSIRYVNGLSEDAEQDQKEALERIEEAVRLGPRDLTVLENAGLVWTHHGQATRAKETLRKAVDLAPLDLIAWGYLAFALGFTGDEEELEEAVSITDRLLEMAPRHPSRPYWNYFRSAAMTRLGRLDEAVAAANKVLEDQPAYYLAHLLLANLHGRREEIDEAGAKFNVMQQINPAMTPKLVVDRTVEICTSAEKAEPLLGGLRRAGILGTGAASGSNHAVSSA